MKYKMIEEKICDDDELFNTGERVIDISRRTGIDYSLLTNLKNGKRIPTYTKYLEYREKILDTTTNKVA